MWNLYKELLNENLYQMIYQKIKKQQNNIIYVENQQIINKLSKKTINQFISSLKNERFEWKFIKNIIFLKKKK